MKLRVMFLAARVCIAIALTLCAYASTPPYSIIRLDGSFLGCVRIDANNAMIYGTDGIVNSSTDKGKNWKSIVGLPEESFTGHALLPNKSVLLFGRASGSIALITHPYSSARMLPFIMNQVQPFKSGCPVSDTEVIGLDNYGMASLYKVGDTIVRPHPALSKFNVQCMIKLRSGVLMAGTTQGVLRSFNSGKSWELVRSDASSQSEAVYAYVTDSDTAVFCFCDASQTSERLHITGDTGKTWRTSPVLSLAGPVLWYGSGNSLIYNTRGVKGSMLVNTTARVEFLYKPVSRIVPCAIDTSRFMDYPKIVGAMAFDSLCAIMYGRNKTLFRSEDGGRSYALRSHISDPSVLMGSNYKMTSVYNDDILSWSGPDQRYSSSTDGGATWMPRKPPVGYSIIPYARANLYKLLTEKFYVGASGYERLDVSSDGGETYTHPGIYDSNGSVSEDASATLMFSPDSIFRIAGEYVYFIHDSCRKWEARRGLNLGRGMFYPDSVVLDRDIVWIRTLDKTVFVVIEDQRRKFLTASTWNTFYHNLVLLRTNDFFKTYDTLVTVPWGSINTVFVTRGNTSVFFKKDSILYKSSDKGETWDTLKSGITQKELWFDIPKDSVYVYLEGGNVRITRDSGRTWISVPPPVSDSLFYWNIVGFTKRRAFVSSNVRDITNLYRIDFAPDSGITQSVEAEPPSKPSPVWVRAAIPNPFSTIVSFTVGAAPGVPRAEVQVGVYSIDGRKITDLSSEYMQHVPGENGEVTLQWDGAQAAQGIYRIVVQSPQGTQSVSVIKAR